MAGHVMARQVRFFYQILYITFLTLIVGSWIVPAVCSESTYP